MIQAPPYSPILAVVRSLMSQLYQHDRNFSMTFDHDWKIKSCKNFQETKFFSMRIFFRFECSRFFSRKFGITWLQKFWPTAELNFFKLFWLMWKFLSLCRMQHDRFKHWGWLAFGDDRNPGFSGKPKLTRFLSGISSAHFDYHPSSHRSGSFNYFGLHSGSTMSDNMVAGSIDPPDTLSVMN